MISISANRDRAPVHGGPLQAPELPSELRVRLLEAVGLESLAAPEDAVPAAPGPAQPASWQEQLARACGPHPLRLRPVFLSIGEAVGAAASRTPLVGYSESAGWFVLLDRLQGRTLLAGPAKDRWLTATELTLALGAASPDDVRAWVLIEPSRPCIEVATPAGAPGLSPFRRLLKLVRPDRTDLWSIVLFAIGIGGLTLATPIAVQQLVNTVAFGGLVQPVVVVALLLFGGLSFSAVLSVLQAYVAETIQRRVFVRVVMDLAGRLPRVSPEAFELRSGPEVVNRIFDVFTVQKTGAALLLEGTSVVLQTVVGLIVLSFYHPLMLGFSILLLGGISGVVFVLGRNAVSTAIGESNAKYAVAGWMEELARHPATFRHPGGLRLAVERADRLATRYIVSRRRHYRLVLRQLSGAVGLQVLAGSALLALGGALVVSGQLTLGQLVASELIITAIVAAVAKLGKQLESYYDLLAAVDKLGVLFDLPLEREDGDEAARPAEGTAARPQGPASVELNGVSFSRGSQTLLKNASLKISAGERVLLTGSAGSGKSTLLDLLMGLRAPTEGFVALDGDDLRDLRLIDLRRAVVCVREHEIFPGSVFENVSVAQPGVSSTEVSEALDRVGVLEAIRALPEGLHTGLTATGAPLSDSETAAVMLARAVVARPQLLLLDEGAIPLEPALRSKALDTLFDPDAPWTLVVVSLLSDVRERCSRVVALEDGAALEIGHAAVGGLPC